MDDDDDIIGIKHFGQKELMVEVFTSHNVIEFC